mmetsp:Transcript_3767/g.9178  ORF Transcript_3767/g.9178 Transcript_3767/m.9178 type:complete len:95 (+) Transcript_3767:3-287(+)
MGRKWFTKSGHFGWTHPDAASKEPVLVRADALEVTRPVRATLMDALPPDAEELEMKDADALSDLLIRCLKWIPDQRIVPSDAVNHHFFGSLPPC